MFALCQKRIQPPRREHLTKRRPLFSGPLEEETHRWDSARKAVIVGERCDVRHRYQSVNEYGEVEGWKRPMSLLHKIDRYQSPNEKAVRKHRGYGFVLALIGMALALVAAKYSRQHVFVEFHPSILNSADVKG
jgi:hypothetical protein